MWDLTKVFINQNAHLNDVTISVSTPWADDNLERLEFGFWISLSWLAFGCFIHFLKFYPVLSIGHIKKSQRGRFFHIEDFFV